MTGEEGPLASCCSPAVGGLGRWAGDCGGVFTSAEYLLLALLACRDGEAGRPRLLLGRAKGLDGRSDAWLITDGRRTKGLAFSGESEPFLVGERCEAPFVGDVVGVVARAVAEEAVEF